MLSDLLQILPLILISIASLFLLLQINWRWSIIALSLQYVAIFWLVLSIWPTGLAAVKLVSGWMAGAVLGASISIEENSKISFLSQFPEMRFRLILGFLVIVFVNLSISSISSWLPIPEHLLVGGGILIGMGLMQIGLSKEPLRTVLGLLTILSGFEVYYAYIERSVMVAGFLAIITLGLALIGSYLMNIEQQGKP